MIKSHETCEYFKHFLFGLAKWSEELDIEFDPEWTMQDAQLSCKQACLILKNFKNQIKH